MEKEDWLGALVDCLGVDDAAEWLRDPCPELRHRAPLQAVADGDQQQVIDLVEQMVDD